MGWTYSGDPRTSPRDQIRFLVGDTVEAQPEISNEEISYFLEKFQGVFLPASYAAATLGAKYARSVDKGVGSMHLSASQKSKAYFDLAKYLRQQAIDNGEPGSASGGFAPIPYAGGITVSDKERVNDNSDRVQPFFSRRLGQVDAPSLVAPLPFQ